MTAGAEPNVPGSVNSKGRKRPGPIMAVLIPRGKKLADSLRYGEGPIPANAGFPARPEEIGAFLDVIVKTGRFSPAELDLLKSRFAPYKG